MHQNLGYTYCMNPRRRIEGVSLDVTKWIGSVPSIILHTIFFAGSFLAVFLDLLSFDRMLLVLTTIVSLEAIYLAIFIQMSLNLARESLKEVEEDIDEIQEDVSEIEKDVDEIQEDVGEIQEDIEEEKTTQS